MHNKPETLGNIIKLAREQSNFTVEELAEKVGISERYLYKIENEGKKPSYDVLYTLIRTLSISPDLIFYPEKKLNTIDIDMLISKINNRNIKTIIDIVNVLSSNEYL